MNDSRHPKLIYVLFLLKPGSKIIRIGQAGLKDQSLINLPAGSTQLIQAARAKARTDLAGTEGKWEIAHAEAAISLTANTINLFTVTAVKRILEMSGIQQAQDGNNWYECSPETAVNAIRAAKEGRKTLNDHEKTDWQFSRYYQKETSHQKKTGHKRKGTHAAADAMDWNDAQNIMYSLKEDARYRDVMLVAVGCYMGLRISDSLELRWKDIIGQEKLEITERKTGKKRTIRINPSLASITRECYDELYIDNPSEFIAKSSQNGGLTHITRQRVNQIIKDIKDRYMPGKAIVFSSHTFRKTFGRRVYENECKKGRGETALMLLAEVFGHSNTNITKRYLGIRKEEILSVYDVL